MHTQQITQSGNQTMPSKALIMIHGRGSNAQDIMSLSDYLQVPDFLLLGPQAASNTWYPHSFIAPVVNNQPYLDDSLAVIEESVELAKSKGVTPGDLSIRLFSRGLPGVGIREQTRTAIRRDRGFQRGLNRGAIRPQ